MQTNGMVMNTGFPLEAPENKQQQQKKQIKKV